MTGVPDPAGPRWRRAAARVARAPRWVMIVAWVVVLGSGFLGWAALDVIHRGFVAPARFAGGVLATWAITYVYFVVAHEGEVLEAIDLSEAPVVALALILPPGEAVLAVAAGSVLSQLFARRGLAKKVFNVGVRCVGAGLVGIAAAAAGHGGGLRPGVVGAVLAAAILYTVSGLVAVGAVVSAVNGGPLLPNIVSGWPQRTVGWMAAVMIGLASAALALSRPWALLGMVCALGLLRYATESLHREHRERERLECLIEATATVLDADDEAGQEAAVLDAAAKLLLWRDVVLRDEPPGEHQLGTLLRRPDGRPRWIVASSRPGGDPWSDNDRRILDALAAAVNAAFDRARMQQELVRWATVDPLTGAANRRELEARLADALAHDEPVGVVVIDLDGFKPVNDQLGHQTGDDLLRVISQRLMGTVRTCDLVARIGGDEFVILLGSATPAAAERVVRDVRDAIAEPVAVGSWRLVVTGSAGAAVAPADGRDAKALLRIADERMYAQKRSSTGHGLLAVDQSGASNIRPIAR